MRISNIQSYYNISGFNKKSEYNRICFGSEPDRFVHKAVDPHLHAMEQAKQAFSEADRMKKESADLISQAETLKAERLRILAELEENTLKPALEQAIKDKDDNRIIETGKQLVILYEKQEKEPEIPKVFVQLLENTSEASLPLVEKIITDYAMSKGPENIKRSGLVRVEFERALKSDIDVNTKFRVGVSAAKIELATDDRFNAAIMLAATCRAVKYNPDKTAMLRQIFQENQLEREIDLSGKDAYSRLVDTFLGKELRILMAKESEKKQRRKT